MKEVLKVKIRPEISFSRNIMWKKGDPKEYPCLWISVWSLVAILSFTSYKFPVKNHAKKRYYKYFLNYNFSMASGCYFGFSRKKHAPLLGKFGIFLNNFENFVLKYA